jgi:hypothetical protein
MDVENAIHLCSPFIYAWYVHIIQKISPCPNNPVMKFCRTAHNVNLSFLSAMMFAYGFIGQFQSGKFNSIDSFLCECYNDNWYMNVAVKAFLYSKYIEWGDTLFLQLSGKPISMLQYTHHMSTAILTYVAMDKTVMSPHTLVFLGTNTLVHTPMYWYFAYPKGFLYPYRRMITQSQILQHVLCIGTIVYTMSINNCEQAEYANIFGLSMYCMYLFYFVSFYFGNQKTE